MESSTTMMETREGTCDGSGRIITLWGEHRDPASGETKKTKLVYRLVDRHHYTLEISELRPEGEDFTFYQADYRRL
jgi:hypothetical protein